EPEEAPDAVVGMYQVVADGELRRVVDGLARGPLEAPAALVAVEELLGEHDLHALGIAVATLSLARQQEGDLTGAFLQMVPPVRLVLVDDLLAEVTAGALELEEQVDGVPVAQPHVHVLGEGGQLAAVVAEGLERYRRLVQVERVTTERDDRAARQVTPQPGGAGHGRRRLCLGRVRRLASALG